jgi:predicted  nucleic acid-binding Zn-ribbon protein
MEKHELDLLVKLQDLDMMISELEEVSKIGFEVGGKKNIEEARTELVNQISRPLLYTYEKLRKRYKRAIVPVKNHVCLGCFMRVPTSLSVRGREDTAVYTCEGCGRILYWLE